LENSAELVTYLEEIKKKTGKPTIVFAHSMGGLVALHALARAPDPSIFKGILFGSTPFNGTPNILQPFKHGDSIMMNKEICSPSTVFCERAAL
jgi:pimeloyl-ACP methyl ester carboxylesterase